MPEEDMPLLVPLEALHRILADCENYGECVLYIQRNEEKEVAQLNVIDPTTVREARNALGHLMGFFQVAKSLPPVFFDKKEMIKLKVVE